jgi:hypothetical protein
LSFREALKVCGMSGRPTFAAVKRGSELIGISIRMLESGSRNVGRLGGLRTCHHSAASKFGSAG